MICIENHAFYALFDKVIERVCEKQRVTADKWLSPEEAMHLLRIKSKSTLQKLRDEGKICGSYLGSRLVLYDRQSIIDYLEDFTYETF